MLMSRSRNKTEYIPLARDYRDAGPEIERLGQRIDAVRTALDAARRSKSAWGIKHWSGLEALLLRRWKMLINLKDVGARSTGRTPYEIDNSWWEASDEITALSLPGFDAFERWCNDRWQNLRLQDGLTRSWEKARNELIQKARQGLV